MLVVVAHLTIVAAPMLAVLVAVEPVAQMEPLEQQILVVAAELLAVELILQAQAVRELLSYPIQAVNNLVVVPLLVQAVTLYTHLHHPAH